MEFRESYSYDDILLVPRFSDLHSRNDADISMEGYDLPIVMSPMDTITTPEMVDLFLESNLIATVHRYFKSGEEQLAYMHSDNKITNKSRLDKAFFAVGSVLKYREWIDLLLQAGVKNFLVDLAHGDSLASIETVKYLDLHVGSIMAGNVATKSGFERLQNAGAKYIRCGVGAGSICETRLNTGFGVPQFTAITDCASRKNKGVFLIADGGIKNNGDIAKAMAGGADFAMLGKVLAGTDLAAGDCYDKNKELSPLQKDICFKGYHGMASRKAREGVLSYASIEGACGMIPYTGKTENLLNDIKLNLKASMSYCGTRNWTEFKKNVKIIKISDSSILENGTHLSSYN